MVCRHSPGDPNCSSSRNYNDWNYTIQTTTTPVTPDSENFEIEDASQVGNHLVLKAKYPNCIKCSFEGTKIMVFLNCTTLDALKWREIDPHFTDKKPHSNKKAPSPVARFPATKEGWEDAIEFAKRKAK